MMRTFKSILKRHYMTPDPLRTPVVKEVGKLLGYPVLMHLGGNVYIHTPRGSYLSEFDGKESIIFSYAVNELRHHLRGYRPIHVTHSVPSANTDTLVARFGPYQLWGNSGLFFSSRGLGNYKMDRSRYSTFWVANDEYPGARLYFPESCRSLNRIDEIAKAFLSVYDNFN
jgi:hypothetical protein